MYQGRIPIIAICRRLPRFIVGFPCHFLLCILSLAVALFPSTVLIFLLQNGIILLWPRNSQLMPADVTAALWDVDGNLCLKHRLLRLFLLSESFLYCRQFIGYRPEGQMSASPLDELKRDYIAVRMFKD